jgi:hypothetical protein
MLTMSSVAGVAPCGTLGSVSIAKTSLVWDTCPARRPVPRRRNHANLRPSQGSAYSYGAAGWAGSWSPGNMGLAQSSIQLSMWKEAAVTTAAGMATQKSTGLWSALGVGDAFGVALGELERVHDDGDGHGRPQQDLGQAMAGGVASDGFCRHPGEADQDD